MNMQHAVKRRVKPALFSDADRPRAIRLGPARGVHMILNRQHDLRRELGLWESELHHTYRNLIRPNTVVWDIGAGDGYTTLLYANLGAHVTAFEPDPAVVAQLERNLALNPTLAERIQIVPDRFETIPPDTPPPGFVKVDVDGGELAVLDALEAVVQHRPPIVVETHGSQLEALTHAKLKQLGYRVTVIGNARWKRWLAPEHRPGFDTNRWLLGHHRS